MHRAETVSCTRWYLISSQMLKGFTCLQWDVRRNVTVGNEMRFNPHFEKQSKNQPRSKHIHHVLKTATNFLLPLCSSARVSSSRNKDKALDKTTTVLAWKMQRQQINISRYKEGGKAL